MTAKGNRTNRTLKKGDEPAPVVVRVAASKARWLARFRKGDGSISAACKAADIGRQTWYDWLANDPAFAAQVREAKEEKADELEVAAQRRAKKDSDTLLIFLLKNLRPDQYREKQQITVVSPEVRDRLDQQVALIAARATWDSSELLSQLDGVWS